LAAGLFLVSGLAGIRPFAIASRAGRFHIPCAALFAFCIDTRFCAEVIVETLGFGLPIAMTTYPSSVHAYEQQATRTSHASS
jgi:hypothetical protein